MKRFAYPLGVLAMGGLILLSGCAKKNPQLKWQGFESPGGGFTVNLPEGPTENEARVVETGVGPVWIYSTSVEVNEVTFEAAYHDLISLDTSKITSADVDRLLKSEVDGAIKAFSGAQVVYRKPVSYDNFRGEEFQVKGTVNGKEFVVTSRVFLIGIRFYELIVDCAPGDVSAETLKKFMDSFQVAM